MEKHNVSRSAGWNLGFPKLTYLATNPLQVTGTLRIAIAGTVLGTSLVSWVLRASSVLVHGDEVDGAVEAAAQFAVLNIESNFVAVHGKHLVLVVTVHEIKSGTNVSSVLVRVAELQGHSVTGGGNTVRSRVVSALDGTVRGAGLGVRASGRVPRVAVVAVLVTVDDVRPSPVGVDDHLTVDVCTRTGRSACLPGDLGVRLGILLANLLGVTQSQQSRESDSGRFAVHGERKMLAGVGSEI